MKKGLFTLLIIVLMIALIGCNSNEPAEQTDGGEVSEKTVLTVATSADFPPFEYIEIVDGKEQIVGFDIDLMGEIAKELDMEIEFENMTFDGIVAAVQTEKVDMAVSGMNPTPERLEKVNFSEPYYYASQTLLVKKSGEEITNMDQLQGKIVGSQIGSTSDGVISAFDGIEVKKYDLVNDAVLDLNNGRIDAVILEDSIAAEFAVKNAELQVIVPDGLNTEEQPFGIVLPKEDEELLNKINTALQNIKDSGKYDELINKYGLANTLK